MTNHRQKLFNYFHQEHGISLMDSDYNELDNYAAAVEAEKVYQIIEVHEPPYFRKMRVESGWFYNFYDCVKDEYQSNWSFVPDAPYQPEGSNRHFKVEKDEFGNITKTEQP